MKMPEDGPHGYDAPLVRLIQKARLIEREIGAGNVLMVIQIALTGLILWRIW